MRNAINNVQEFFLRSPHCITTTAVICYVLFMLRVVTGLERAVLDYSDITTFSLFALNIGLKRYVFDF